MNHIRSYAAAFAVLSSSILVGRADLPNGVAAGDTTATDTVLWTHSTTLGSVLFEISIDPAFGSIAGSSTAIVTDPLAPVKVGFNGLTADTQYFYRATDAMSSTASGRFATAAPAGVQAGLRFGVSGDSRGELSPYPSIKNAPGRNLDFFANLGDTIYADFSSPDLPQPQAVTLSDYRIKNNEVYSTRFGVNTLRDLRQSTSTLATIDDHEVINDFAGGALASADSRFNDNTPGRLINDTALYDNGLQAFHEYNPIRDEFYGVVPEARLSGERKLYRENTYGRDAVVLTLDARSFRDQGLPGVTNPSDPVAVGTFLGNSFFQDRTMLGRTQLADLKADLAEAQANGTTWKFVMVPEPIQNLGVVAASDRFEGYAFERNDLLRFIDTNHIENVVFIAADIHGTIVNNLTYENTLPGPASLEIQTGAFEITTGAIAFDAPFGPTVVSLAAGLGLLTPQEFAFYNSLPRAGKDQFVKSLVNGQLAPQGYDLIGLESSLLTGIDATLLQGDYVAVHTFGWTEFEIDPLTQELLVTTYGIDGYTAAELNANPSAITARNPEIVSQFSVRPIPEPSTASLLAVAGMIGLLRRPRVSKSRGV